MRLGLSLELGEDGAVGLGADLEASTLLEREVVSLRTDAVLVDVERLLGDLRRGLLDFLTERAAAQVTLFLVEHGVSENAQTVHDSRSFGEQSHLCSPIECKSTGNGSDRNSLVRS